jgi:hypothetical protein
MAVPMQVNLALQILTGEVESGTLIKFDCMEPMVRKIKVPVRDGCECRAKRG